MYRKMKLYPRVFCHVNSTTWLNTCVKAVVKLLRPKKQLSQLSQLAAVARVDARAVVQLSQLVVEDYKLSFVEGYRLSQLLFVEGC